MKSFSCVRGVQQVQGLERDASSIVFASYHCLEGKARISMTPPLLSIPMRHFLEVARSGSVSQAAARLFVASSAVSRQITKLEDSLGTPLFERHARGMALNAAGERLAAHLRNAQ